MKRDGYLGGKSGFKVFHCGYFRALGEIVAIVTGEHSKNQIETECYYLIKGKNPKVRGPIRVTKDVEPGDKKRLFSAIEELWKLETYVSLKIGIFRKDIRPLIKDRKDPLWEREKFERELKLSEIGEHSLLSLNFENPVFIKYIAKNTSCTAFKYFGKILRAIKINRVPIPYQEE